MSHDQQVSKLNLKMIHLFNVEPKDQDDFYQEAIILLVDTVYTFNEQKNKTFTRYFELVLKRRFIRLKQQLPLGNFMIR